MDMPDTARAQTLGLSQAEAALRLKDEGYNELPSSKPRSVWAIAWNVLREPMLLLLVACGVVYLILGDIQEALLLIASILVIIGITFYQEEKTERVLDALKNLSSPRALVMRDGRKQRIAGREVVPGDVVFLAEGDRVSADAWVFSATNLSIDESLLTGESVPVRKQASASVPQPTHPGGEDLAWVYSGTLVVQGRAQARVAATGIKTELGKISRSLQAVEEPASPLQQETSRLVRWLASVGLSLCAMVVLLYGITRGNWLQGFLAGLTLAMSLLPEEIPVVLTIFLALGAWRMSRMHVLTRRVLALEALGAARILCVDKTGTITQNRMVVQRIFLDDVGLEILDNKALDLPDDARKLLACAALGSQSDSADPMEQALESFIRFAPDMLPGGEGWQFVREYPLSRQLLAMSRVWQHPDRPDAVIAAKGAPEAVARLCRLDGATQKQLMSHVQSLAQEGLRVLGIAQGAVPKGVLADSQEAVAFEWLGLVGLADPIRPAVPQAVAECKSAGIRVIMITGDYPTTAQTIARAIGMDMGEGVITGPEMDGMDDQELAARIQRANLFARVVPEQKLRLVNALRADGSVVAMTGDGVNDAPALKSADIGIAMGQRGTDVAREAADLVLLDDDFSSIVAAIRLGRRIFDNIRKAMAYILAVHLPIAGLSLVPILMGWPLILMPVHIVFLELIIDPACSIVFEAEADEDDVMMRPPREARSRIFGPHIIRLSLLQGASVLAIVLAVFWLALSLQHDDRQARALTFTTLIIANLALIFTNRSWSRTIVGMMGRPNRALWVVTVGALALLALVLYVPALRDLFRLSVLHPLDLGICAGAGAVSVIWFEVMKVLHRLGGAKPSSGALEGTARIDL